MFRYATRPDDKAAISYNSSCKEVEQVAIDGEQNAFQEYANPIDAGLHRIDRFKTPDRFSKKQIYDNSCGAVALLCAAKELGISDIPALKGSISEIYGLTSLEMDNRCESDIYAMTSKADPRNLEKAGYSMPDGIVTAGRILGLDMHVVEEAGIFSKILNWIYPSARKNLEEINCPIENRASPLPERQVKIEAMTVSVGVVPIGLHWVLCRNDGSYMDPMNGKNSSNFSEMISNVKATSARVFSYDKTGISIIAKRSIEPSSQ